ncbi:ROK family transcriptional regulator [Nonomuraea sp. B12E4]|uniref:ROK family transcriptional regulator n=1 Tax=Nonomuraea sp. B12E4 TaxID=3153564 RepID=UPI00325DA69E
MAHMQLGTNLPRVAGYNRAVVLEAIQASDGISRVQIAARTRLTAQTVSVIVRRLLGEGLVVEDGSAPSSGGKRRTILRVDARAGFAVGVHFDPQEISCVLADLAGRPVTRLRLPVRPGAGPEAVIRQMARSARRILREAEVPDGKVLGVGLACPGPLDGQGVMVSPPRLPGWDQVPIKSLLHEHEPDGPECYCGNRGCVEAVCCPSAIEAAMGGKLTHAAICARAAEGEPAARKVIERVAGRLAVAAVSVVNMLDIDLLVLGGPALREVGEIYREVIARAVSGRSLARRLHVVRVRTSPIAADAAAIGAASLVFHATYAPRLDTLLSV